MKNIKYTENEIIQKIKAHDLSIVNEIPLEYKFKDNSYLIHQACLFNNFDLLLYLLSKECDIEIKGGKYENTPLFYNIYNENIDGLYLLLEAGANVNYKNNKGFSILHYCVKFNSILSFILLLHYKADLFLQDFELRNVFEYAKIENKFRFLEVLKKIKNDKTYEFEIENKFKNYKIFNFLKKDNGKTNQENIIDSENKVDLKEREKTRLKNLQLQKQNLKNFKIFINDILKLFLCLFLHTVSIYYFKIFFLLWICFSYFFKRKLMDYKYFTIVNLFYSLYFCKKIYSYDQKYLPMLIFYILLILYLITNKQKKVEKNFYRSFYIIKNLIKHEKYNLRNFCYICWIEKKENTDHCHLCKSCIIEHDHHCTFLDNCIGRYNLKSFIFYLAFSLLLLYFQSDIKLGINLRFHFKILTLFVIVQCLNRISIILDK